MFIAKKNGITKPNSAPINFKIISISLLFYLIKYFFQMSQHIVPGSMDDSG
jgi:hypothetical protein